MTENHKVDNRRIAKNTVFLYLRMFLLMGIGLYTSRINLLSLGVDNFGVYNVVAGFIVLFGAVTGSMGNSISRFLQVELGKGNKEKLQLVFSTAINVQLAMGVLVAIVGELVGLWFLYYKMQIPAESFYAAKWILHFSIFQFILGLLMIPFTVSIISHERMGAFAYLSILEAVLKLMVAFSVFYTPFDKLITFGALILCNQLIINLVYVIYCRRHFIECRYRFRIEKGLIREMTGFAGWNLITQSAYLLNIQGINMLMNIFFGVVVNAARGVANQVNNAVRQFINNFMMAYLPQITKSYAAGDKNYSFSLVCRGARYSYFLMFFLSLPIIIEADMILDFWLKEPPEYSIIFVRWQLAASLTTVFGNTLFNLIMADGRIRMYQSVMAVVGFTPFVFSWVAFSIGLPVVSSYIVYFIIYFLLIFIRFYLVHKVTGLPTKDYIGGVLGRVFIVSLASSAIPFVLHLYLPASFIRLIIVGGSCIICTMVAIWFWGMTYGEHQVVIIKVKQLKNKLLSKV